MCRPEEGSLGNHIYKTSAAMDCLDIFSPTLSRSIGILIYAQISQFKFLYMSLLIIVKKRSMSSSLQAFTYRRMMFYINFTRQVANIWCLSYFKPVTNKMHIFVFHAWAVLICVMHHTVNHQEAYACCREGQSTHMHILHMGNILSQSPSLSNIIVLYSIFFMVWQ